MRLYWHSVSQEVAPVFIDQRNSIYFGLEEVTCPSIVLYQFLTSGQYLLALNFKIIIYTLEKCFVPSTTNNLL